MAVLNFFAKVYKKAVTIFQLSYKNRLESLLKIDDIPSIFQRISQRAPLGMRYYITISGIEKFKELVKCWKLFHSNIWIGQKKNLNTKVFALSNQNSDATIRRCSTKFRDIHRKKPVLESFFQKKLQSFYRATPGNCF